MDTGNCKHRLLIENLPDAFAYHQVVTDREGEPVDYIFLDVNRAFEKMTGLTREQVKGKKVTELHPGIENSGFDWIGTYGRVAFTGGSISFEQYFEIADRWYAITACSDETGYFAVLFRDITERKQAEEKLEEEHTLRMNLLNNIPGCIALILQKETRKIVASNKAAQEIGAVPGAKCYETCAKRNDECAFCLAPVLWATGEQKEIEVNYQGTWYQGIWAPLSEELYVHYIFDITERKQIEEALKASEERLDLAMAVKNEGCWDWNLVTNETFFDDRYYTMAGYAPNEFPQTFSAWAERVHPDDLPNAELSIQNYLAGKSERFDIEFRFKHKDGSWIWIQGQGKIVERDSNGSPLRMIGTHTEITERKRVEQELIAQQELLEGVMDNVSDVLAIQRQDLSIVRYNQAGYELLGMTPEEVIGKKCYELIGRNRECEECATIRAVESKRLAEIEKFVPKLGAYLNCRSNPVLDEDGNLLYIV